MGIATIIEGQRGCGHRKKGGYYLIGGAESSPCCKLPFILTICPCCSAGIKFSRGFTWITSALFGTKLCASSMGEFESGPNYCPIAGGEQRMGLMWVGEKYYPTVMDFQAEARLMGISKRIGSVPNVVPGETWIALAHNAAIIRQNGEHEQFAEYVASGGHGTFESWLKVGLFDKKNILIKVPAVFMVFRLKAIQYVVTGQETDKELEAIENRGIDLVDIVPPASQAALNI